jgi:tetratricopeptide (TPR) repeat protein
MTPSPADALDRFERAGEHDEAGREAEAIPLYRDAIALGLVDPERSRAVVQLASSLRNVGELDEALDLLDTGGVGSSALDPELAASVAAFRALVLHDLGRHDEALAAALGALAPTLPAYRISIAAYADALVLSDAAPGSPA